MDFLLGEKCNTHCATCFIGLKGARSNSDPQTNIGKYFFYQKIYESGFPP